MLEMETASEVTSLNKDHYMTPSQIDHFHAKLLALKAEIEHAFHQSLLKIKEMDTRPIEEMERSVWAFDRDMAIRTQTMNGRLLRQIDQALERIHDGNYGYCVETEEPIGLRRLEANPLCSFCLSVQERYEKYDRNKTYHRTWV